MNDRIARRDPYTESGRYAAVLRRSRMTKAALVNSIEDADELEQRGHRVIARGGRSMVLALLAVLGTLGGAIASGSAAFGSYDGSYDGTLRANWMMLLAIVGLIAAQFAWMWFVKSRELRQTGRRLIQRSEYQRRLSSLQLQEAERNSHEALC